MTYPAGDENARSELVAGKYQLTRLVGQGGMGAVWEGVHTTLGTRVAVKFIEPQYLQNAEALTRFENEARAAAALQSRHVVQVFDHGLMLDGRPYIVMEFLSGEPLDKRLDRVARLTPIETARLVVQVCRALAKAHQAGIVHRDLKPENVFLVWDAEENADVTKVVDFGIAKFADRSTMTSATRTGSVLGTPFYMSPEQARGLRSVGVIAYQCLVGRLPFHGESVGDLLVTICTAPLPVPTVEAPDIPAAFNAWFARALARNPDERFQSAAALAESLCEAVGATVQQESWGTATKRNSATLMDAPHITNRVSPATPEPVVVEPATSGGRSRKVALALAGLAAVAGVVAFALPRNDAASQTPPAASVAAPEAPRAAEPPPAETAKPEPPPVQTQQAVASAAPAASVAPSSTPAVEAAPAARTPRGHRAPAGRGPKGPAVAEPAPAPEPAPVTKPPEPAVTKPAKPAVDIDKDDPWKK
jgi:eukaryotic-like serine/threonine-protein kinase